MKKTSKLTASRRLLTSLGLVCLLSGVLLQTFQAEAIASSSGHRDGFPGRRRGGGTHWVLPPTLVSQ